MHRKAGWTSPVRRLIDSPSAYDALQFAVGANHLRSRLTAALSATASRTVLDVGAGTGLYATCLPRLARYIWFDNDPNKLRGFLRRRVEARAVLGDATEMGLQDKSVDYAMCVGITHHLNDADAAILVSELSRVSRRGIIVLDSVACGRWLSYPLWKLDRGSFPRPKAALLDLFGAGFRICSTDEFSVFHRYVLITAAPITAAARVGRFAAVTSASREDTRQRTIGWRRRL